MKRKNPWKSVSRLGVADKEIPKPDRINYEGFPAYSRTPEEELLNVLMTGTTANTFYASMPENLMQFADLMIKFEDVEFMAKATVYAREHGYMRMMPIASTVALSTKDRELYELIVHRVCRTPTDWQKLIDICRAKVFRNGLGRMIKRTIIQALATMPTYHAMKYPKAVKDMIRIARPREEVNPAVIKYIMEGDHSLDYQLEALYRLKTAESDREVIKAIQDGRLPFEVVTGSVKKMTPAIWEALLYQAPYFNLIRNLNNFLRNGVFDREENIEYAVKKIANKEAIRNSKLFPFRFYVAHEMLKREASRLNKEKSARRILNALRKAVEISVESMPEIDSKVVIAPDVSGSMSSHVTGDYSVLQCIDIVGIFTAMLIKKCKQLPILLPFESKIRYDMAQKAYEGETVFDIASAFVPTGGTSLSAPIEKLLNNREKVDYIVAFTDNEEWVGRSFIEALNDYLRFNPEVQIYLVTLMPYRHYPVPVDYPNVHFIFGWSDSVLRYILTTDPAKQMEEVKNLKL